jgi:hypothetical protein
MGVTLEEHLSEAKTSESTNDGVDVEIETPWTGGTKEEATPARDMFQSFNESDVLFHVSNRK